jgi:nicotinate-nucleotide pyrophosphorylase (carboxylating)
MQRLQRTRAAFGADRFRLSRDEYDRFIRALTGVLIEADHAAADLTTATLGLAGGRRQAQIVAKQAGVIAGLAEALALADSYGVSGKGLVADGAAAEAGQPVLRLAGPADALLQIERTLLNLLQRMSGIATATRALVEAYPAVTLAATRKTPLGFVDKKAVFLGGGATHRLHLADAVLIKDNHLAALAAQGSADPIRAALTAAWVRRAESRFIELEVTTASDLMHAADVVKEIVGDETAYPVALMLDNFSPDAAAAAIDGLRGAGLYDAVLLEISGGVTPDNLAAYAACGADVISLGWLTHSPAALDLSLRLTDGAAHE